MNDIRSAQVMDGRMSCDEILEELRRWKAETVPLNLVSTTVSAFLECNVWGIACGVYGVKCKVEGGGWRVQSLVGDSGAERLRRYP